MKQRESNCDYIRRMYGVPAKPGGRIRWHGKEGTIRRATTELHRLHVLFDGERHKSLLHPTDDVEYLPEQAHA